MANKVTIDVEARFVDNVSGEAGAASNAFKKVETNARSAAKAVDNLGKKAAAPKLDANTDKFKKAIDDSDKKLQKFGKSKAEAKLGAEDRATSVITRAMNKLKSWARNPKAAVLQARDYATAKIRNAISLGRNFAGKTYSGMIKIRDSEALSSLRKITSGAEKFTGKTWSAVVKIKDAFTSPLRALKNSLFSIKTLIGGIAAAWATVNFVKNPINLADQYSSAKIGFSTLMGEEGGQQMMNDLDAFAKKTPFKTSGVISAAQKMMAMGWDAGNIIGDLEVLGNAAAATGNLDQGLESIVRAMSQIKTKGRLSTEELNQLAEAGIAAKAMLAEQMGYGTGDEGIAAMTKDLENGAIASNEAIAALMAGMQKYNGMMDSMANETVEGLWSQIQDTFEINVFRKWGQGLQDGAKKGFGTVIQLLDEAEGALSEFGDMLYDIGENVSNWVADKFQNAVDRIMSIAGTAEFKEASLGEKISMLWEGVIADPLAEWWEGGGQQKTAETAGKIGKWIGEMLTKGLLALLGVTDIFADSGLSEEGGMSVAQSFAKGFTEGFDASAITDKLVDAIGDVWGALPTWAKFLIGGYVGGKVLGGAGNLVGGITNLIGGVGSILGSPTAMTGIAGMGVNTAIGLGAGNLAGGAALGGAGLTALGLGGIAGGLAAGASFIKGGVDLYGSYKAYKSGDTTEGDAKAVSGGTTLAGIAGGAAVGAAIGSVVPVIGTALGGIIGAGVGGIAGWLGGNKLADGVREEAAIAENEALKRMTAAEKASAKRAAAQKEAAEKMQQAETAAEKAAIFNEKKLEVARTLFGDISLSMEEISRLSQQLVFGDDLPKYEKFVAATQQAKASLQALNAAGQQTDKWMWRASLGLEFNEDEVASIKASFDEYISSAKKYAEDKHYEFTTSAELLLDLDSATGKSILESGNAYYAQTQKELNTYGKELGDLLTKSLADGFINADESAAIAAAQQKIAEITKKIADAESDAELTLIDLKYGGGKLDEDSFTTFMQTIEANLNEKLSSADAAVKAQISNLNLRFPTDADKQTQEYKDQLQAILDGYNLEVESVTADILGFELNIIGDMLNGDDMLGADALDDLNNIIQTCLNEGIEPAEMDLSRLIELSGNSDMGDVNAGLIQDYLQSVFDQLDLSQFEFIEVDGKMQLKMKPEVTVEEGTAEQVQAAVDGQVPDTVSESVSVNVTPQTFCQTVEEITGEDFNVPELVSDSVLLKLNAAKTFPEQVSVLATEFDLPPSVAETIILELTGEKDITPVSVSADELCPQSTVTKTVTVNIVGVKGSVTGVSADGGGFRGGIFGGTSAMGSYARGGIAGKVAGNIPGFSDGGIVRGGSQLIEVAEEGSPEMVIPLSSQRRGRALKLWAQAGNMMGVPGFARGGIIGGDGSSDEGIRFHTVGGEDSSVSQSSQVDVGGITVQINVTAGANGNIADAIRAQANEITEAVAGIMADAISGQFENTPVRGGAA